MHVHSIRHLRVTMDARGDVRIWRSTIIRRCANAQQQRPNAPSQLVVDQATDRRKLSELRKVDLHGRPFCGVTNL